MSYALAVRCRGGAQRFRLEYVRKADTDFASSLAGAILEKITEETKREQELPFFEFFVNCLTRQKKESRIGA